jgi:hypothetical protein
VVVDWTYKFSVLDIKYVFAASFLPIFHQHMLSSSGLMWGVLFEFLKMLRKSGLDGSSRLSYIFEFTSSSSTCNFVCCWFIFIVFFVLGCSIWCSWAYAGERWEETRLQTQIWYPELRTYPVNNHKKLDFYESYQIHREDADHLMNQDQGPLKSPLFDVILKNNATWIKT